MIPLVLCLALAPVVMCQSMWKSEGWSSQNQPGWDSKKQSQQQQNSGFNPNPKNGWDQPSQSAWGTQPHSQLDRLAHGASHKAIEAQQAGQVLKEMEHNILHQVSWSTHNILGSLQQMPETGRVMYDLQQRFGHASTVMNMLSNGANTASLAVERRTNEQVSKLEKLNEELKRMMRLLEKLA